MLSKALVLSLAIASISSGQSVTEHLAAGDRAYLAMDARAALAHYEAAVAADSNNYDALCKASRSAADLERPARGNRAAWDPLVRKAERYARRAVALRPDEAEGHFALSRALGLRARVAGVREGVKLATAVRNEALACLRHRPEHSGCLHIMGVWNAEIMRLKGWERFLARTVLGGGVFGTASWNEAIRYLERAVTAAPSRIIHRLELAEVYRERGRFDDARRELRTVLRMASTDFNDDTYKAQARSTLDRLGNS